METSGAEIERAAAIASLLSNATRARIVAVLVEGPRIVGEIAAAIGEAQATVSKQLGILRDGGLLCCRTEGRCREYGLTDPGLARQILASLAELGRQAEDTPRRRELAAGEA